MAENGPHAAGRLQTGIERLDSLLGGGLIPGTLTVVLGATGIGKTQLGLTFAQQGGSQEGETGIIFDLACRGDSQNHREYAARLFQWNLREQPADDPLDPAVVWDERVRSDYLHIFEQGGRVSLDKLPQEEQRSRKIELAHKLQRTIAFLYGNFIRGVRRCVVDGVEPIERAADSFQLNLFEYVHDQILRKDSQWVARDLFRAQFRQNEEQAAQRAYDPREVACLLLCTSKEVLLEELVSRPLDSGDLLANANTIIQMGKVPEGRRMGRALHVAKHRGSACDGAIAPFEITDRGLTF